MTRFQHTSQTAALECVAKARTYLATAAGLMRACEREVGEIHVEEGCLSVKEQASELEEAESQLRLVSLLIQKAPAGNVVG